MVAVLTRCQWTGETELMKAYHDTEWGVPVHDDRKHFELMMLEGAQAGLSWETILKKREGYRAAFADFDPWQILTFDQAHVERLLQDPSIIRNRLKVQGAVRNAARFVEVQREFGSFDAYIWSFVGGTTIDRAWATRADVPSTSPESDRLGQDLRKRGFTFVGSKIVYSEMQAAGLVNDHTLDCFRHDELK